MRIFYHSGEIVDDYNQLGIGTVVNRLLIVLHSLNTDLFHQDGFSL